MKKMFVLVLALVMTFAALPAFAQDKADWAFYGSVRMWTAWETVDADTPVALSSSGGFFTVATTNARAIDFGTAAAPNWVGDDEIAWEEQGNSRFGANVKWGNVGGRVEYGYSTGNPTMRLLYGTWNFGSGVLTVGHDYGPYFYLVSGMCGPGGAECNGIGFGSIYSGRNPQLKLSFGGLQFALVRANKQPSFRPGAFTFLPDANARAQQTFITTNQVAATGFKDTDSTLPKIEASYTFNWGPGQFFVGGAYQTYDERYATPAAGGFEKSVSVDGWVLGAGTKLSFGPFYTNATFQFGQNVNNSGTGPATLFPSVKIFNPATGAETDSDYRAAQLILGFKLTDSMVFEGGVVYQTGLFDTGLGDFEQSQLVYYIGFGWSPAKNVVITPELGVIDYDSLKTPGIPDIEFGKLSWFGIKWMINF